jgi:tape measure domain-containing protein
MADEGVEFFLEINAQLDEATKMIRELTKVQAAALRVGKGLVDTEKKVGGFNKSMRAAAASVGEFARNTLAHFAALASFEGLKRLGEGLFDLGREAFAAAGEAERTRKSFQLLMGTQVADDLLDYLDDLAKHTEFTDGALKQFAGELSQAGLSGMALKKGLAAVVDIAALTGNKVEGAANAVALLSKMSLKGEVSIRELLGAKIDPKAFFAQVAKDTGIGIKQVEKAIQDGKVSGEALRGALFETIEKRTGKGLGGAGFAMSATALAQAEKVKDIVPNLMEELEKSGGLRGITMAMSKLVTAFDPSSPAGARLVKSLTEMFDKIGTNLAKIDFDKLSRTLTDLFTKLPALIDATTKAGMAFLDFLAKLGKNNNAGAPPTTAKAFEDVVDAAGGDKGATTRASGRQKAVDAFMKGDVTPGLLDMDASGNGGIEWFPGIKNFLRWRKERLDRFAKPPDWASPVAPTPPAWSIPGNVIPPPGSDQPMTPVRPNSGAGASLLMSKPNQSFAANVTVNVTGAPGDEAGKAALGDQVGASARREMESLLERLAAEGGAT